MPETERSSTWPEMGKSFKGDVAKLCLAQFQDQNTNLAGGLEISC